MLQDIAFKKKRKE